jgi:hypothetical protein
LREDFNKSIVVVEKTGQLGGHTETYIDPVTQFPVDYGVLAYLNTSATVEFFKRFDVPLTAVPSTSPFVTKYVDFSTEKVDPGYTPADPTAALNILVRELQKYPYLPGGYNLPDPVPADLLLPFGDFVTKYGIQAAVPSILIFAHGVGELLKSLTLYVFQNFRLPQLESLPAGSFLTTEDHFNSEIYLKVSALLSSDVLYGSTVIDADRYENGMQQITVQTPTGLKLIRAKSF